MTKITLGNRLRSILFVGSAIAAGILLSMATEAQSPSRAPKIYHDLSVVDGFDTTSTGVALTYTVATGETAQLAGASWFSNAGTPATVQLQVVTGATTIVIDEVNASTVWSNLGINLESGDVVRFNVTVVGTTSNADGALSVIEFEE